MKPGEFDLTGKAVDCSGLPALGDAGKEIFRALKVACDGVVAQFDFNQIKDFSFLVLSDDMLTGCSNNLSRTKIQPSDVLGQAAIDAAMDGATIVFEGDVPSPFKGVVYWADGGHQNVNESFDFNLSFKIPIIAYKILGEKPENKENDNDLSNFGAEFEPTRRKLKALGDCYKVQLADACFGDDAGDLDSLAIGGHRNPSETYRDGNEGEEVEILGKALKYKPIFNDDKAKNLIELSESNIRNAITSLEQAKEEIDRRIEALKAIGAL